MSKDREMTLYGEPQHEKDVDASFNYYGEPQHDEESVDTEQLAYEGACSAEASDAWGSIATPTNWNHSRRSRSRIDYADSGAD